MAYKIALIGNPNSGKTTLFNALTGSAQFVGNWPGVTVEKKEGRLRAHPDITVTDLPGIYSLSPYTLEEVVARNYLLNEKPDAVLNIVDGTNIERNLYLTTQVLELGIPCVLAVNMIDLVKKRGDKIDLDKLGDAFGCAVVEVSALRGDGVAAAAERAIELIGKPITEKVTHKFSPDIEDVLERIEKMLTDVPPEKERFYATKLFERDERIKAQLKSPPDIEKLIREYESRYDDDSESIITNERYNYITGVLPRFYEKHDADELTTSDKVDRVLTNRFLALPLFALIMFSIYYISVSSLGGALSDFMNEGVFGDGFEFFGQSVPSIPALVGYALSAASAPLWLVSLVKDGIIAGVGAVLGFLPQLLILFAFLAFLEACGYMSRIAFILDRIFRKFGLSGKSFIPLLVGTGCGVPGIMASRTIENLSDRRMTIITTTFIPCGAKLPIIALVATSLFGGAWWMAPLAYLLGIAAVVCSGIILKKTKAFASGNSPFVMELPPYHFPTFKNVMLSVWERGWSFVKKAGSIILISSVIVWLLSNFGFKNGFGMVEDMSDSILAAIGSLVAPLFAPLGFGNWQSAVATIGGLIAKENVVGISGVLFGFSESGSAAAFAENFTPLAGFSFLMFNLLCAPCIAAMSTIAKEMNSRKWTAFAILWQCGFAYAVSLCIYRIGLFINGEFTVYTVVSFVLALMFLFMLLRRGYIRESTSSVSVSSAVKPVTGECVDCSKCGLCAGKSRKK